MLPSGRRLDIVSSTGHDTFVKEDYKRLKSVGISTARDAVRWHLIETRPYHYDWSSVLPMIHAAQDTGVQVIWDVCHYGWPDDIDVFRPEFVRRFCKFARAFACLLANETDEVPYFSPVNEISFLSWGGGDHAFLNPYACGRGTELKCQLVRASIAAIDAIRAVTSRARFVQVDPIVNVVAEHDASEARRRSAAQYTESQYESTDMLEGRLWPQLGGDPCYLDIIGGNYYIHNQWVLDGKFIERDDPRYRPFHKLLGDLYARYGKPIFVAETGIEDERRPEWLAYVCDEVITALQEGTPVEGICLYPIVNHPGWLDERHCHNGLWDYCNNLGHREIYNPLADELRRQNARIQSVLRRLEAERESLVPAAVFQAGNAGAGAAL